MITSTIHVPDSEIELSYARSSGPGGQNVNKVNSKAVLRWNAQESACFPDFIRARVLARLSSKLTRDGSLIIASDRYRDQIRNREDCLEKLKNLLLSVLIEPKARRKTKPTRGSERRAQESKKHVSQKKGLRKRPSRFE